MFYPTEGTAVNFLAVHPKKEPAGTVSFDSGKWSYKGSFAVQENQSLEKNYLNSDLMFANVANQAPTTSPVKLNFTHRLSKVLLKLTAKEGDFSNLSEIRFTGKNPN